MKEFEPIQRLIARILATNPAGHNLRLIGGFRYRFLDGSVRRSADIDYSWDGDLRGKAREIASLLTRKLLPEAKRLFGCDGAAALAEGPEFDSPFVSVVAVALHRGARAGTRMEIPVEITRIPCLDKPVTRTLDGVVFLTVSDADMAESKVISLFNRTHVQERDLVDIYLFKNHLPPYAGERLRTKFDILGIRRHIVAEAIASLKRNRDIHARNIDAVVREQLDASAAAHIVNAGGGAMVFDKVVAAVEPLTGAGGER